MTQLLSPKVSQSSELGQTKSVSLTLKRAASQQVFQVRRQRSLERVDLGSGIGCVVEETDPTPFPPPAMQVETIQCAFSLTVSHLARILKVTRPTIYAWKAGETELEPANRERLRVIYKLAAERRGFAALGDRAMIPFMEDNKSIVDLLSADVLGDDTLAEIRRRINLLTTGGDKPVQVGDRQDRWREAVGKKGPSWETQESNLEHNIRALRDES